MPALDTDAIIAHYGDLYIGDTEGTAVNVGAIRNLTLTAMPSSLDIESDNKGTVLNKGRMQSKVTCDWLEAGNLDYLAKLFKGLVTLTTQAGTPVVGASQPTTSGNWAYNTPIELTNQMFDGTAPTVTGVSGSVNGALTVNVDYALVKNAGTGRWGVQIIDSATVNTTAQTITITYNYTPAASKKLTGGASATATPFHARIEAPDQEGGTKKRIWKCDKVICKSDMLHQFVNVERSNDVSVMPITLESQPGQTWEYTDEINAA